MVFQRIEGYPKISDFVAIDFETATEKSPCQIGMAVVKDGVIIKTINRLIKPLNNIYNPYTIHIQSLYIILLQKKRGTSLNFLKCGMILKTILMRR